MRSFPKPEELMKLAISGEEFKGLCVFDWCMIISKLNKIGLRFPWKCIHLFLIFCFSSCWVFFCFFTSMEFAMITKIIWVFFPKALLLWYHCQIITVKSRLAYNHAKIWLQMEWQYYQFMQNPTWIEVCCPCNFFVSYQRSIGCVQQIV